MSVTCGSFADDAPQHLFPHRHVAYAIFFDSIDPNRTPAARHVSRSKCTASRTNPPTVSFLGL